MSHRMGLNVDSVSGITPNIQSKLQELNIKTAEEIVAVAAIEGCQKGLAEHLGASAKEIESIVKAAKKELPNRSVAAMEEPYVEEYGMGALEPPEDFLASEVSGPYESMTSAEALPSNVNHIHRMRPIQNQANRGTCVSFACTALNEDYFRQTTGRSPDLSEQCLYMRCKENDGFPDAEGTWTRVGMDCLVRFGEASENCFPYNPNPPTNQPGPHRACCPSESPRWKLPQSQRLNPKSPLDIKGALAADKVVAFSIPVYRSWFRSAAVRRTGNITMPLPNDQREGGHAMLFVGYQDDDSVPGGGYFILRNSWGTQWAPQSIYGAGYGTLPYKYMEDHGKEAFTYRKPQPTCPPRPVCMPRPVIPCPPRPVCRPRPVIPCPPRPVCRPRPIIPCPPRPVCRPRPVIPCPPRPVCRPRPIIPCQPRPFCTPRPVIPCPPRPVCRPRPVILCPPRPVCRPRPIIPCPSRPVCMPRPMRPCLARPFHPRIPHRSMEYPEYAFPEYYPEYEDYPYVYGYPEEYYPEYEDYPYAYDYPEEYYPEYEDYPYACDYPEEYYPEYEHHPYAYDCPEEYYPEYYYPEESEGDEYPGSFEQGSYDPHIEKK